MRELHTKTFNLPNTANDFQGDDVQMWLFRAPVAADGGGIRISAAFYITGAAMGAGTAHTLSLFNYGTAGTAVEGTIGTVGGTAAPVSADTPTAFTLTAAQQLIDAGEWIVLDKQETNSSDPTRGMVVIEYFHGN
jgi:hypothetical protein